MVTVFLAVPTEAVLRLDVLPTGTEAFGKPCGAGALDW